MFLRQKFGFTLIELLVVCAIIGIVLSIAIPRISFDDYYLKAISQELYYDIRYIRNVSMTEGKIYKITFDSSSVSYKISYSGKDIKIVNIKKPIKLIYDDNAISFSHNGAPIDGNVVKIINNKNNRYYRITIVVSSGRILMYKNS